MSEAKLVTIDGQVMQFSDHSTLRMPRGVSAKAVFNTTGSRILCYDLEGKVRSGRIGIGRNKADCQSMLNYLSGKESH